MGSFSPDSTSIVAFSRAFRPTPLCESCAKTAAASVEAMIAPSSSPLRQSRSSAQHAAAPATAAVNSTPSGGQQAGRNDSDADAGARRAQAAVEQDDRQRHVADRRGELVVGERQPERPVHPGEHAHHQEHEQVRHPDAARVQAGHEAQRDETARDHHQQVQRVHRAHPLRCVMRTHSAASKRGEARKRWKERNTDRRNEPTGVREAD